jgi:hypothetical protein
LAIARIGKYKEKKKREQGVAAELGFTELQL